MAPKNYRLPEFIPERLREARLARGLTASELAEAIDVTRQAISQFELGHSAPGGVVLGKIVEKLGFPLSYFSKIKTQHASPAGATFFRSLKSAQRKAREMVTVRADWLEEIYTFLQDYLTFPKVNIPDFTNDGLLTDERIEEIAVAVRRAWGLGLGPISDMVLLMEKNGIILTRTSAGVEKTDACSQWRGERPFVFLCSDKDSAVRSRFDAAHELGHFVLHMWVDSLQISDSATLNQIEKEANRFAAAFLMPIDTFCQEVLSTSLEHFISLKRRWKVSIAAMIYRCESLGIITDYQALYLRKQMSKLGIKTREPLDEDLIPEAPSILCQSIELLLKNNVLSPAEILDAIKLPRDEIESLCGLNPGTLISETKVIPLRLK